MVIESAHLAVQHPYTAEEIAGTVLQIAIKLKYINKENLTAKGKVLLSDAEKYEPVGD